MNKVHLIDYMEFMRGIPDKYYELAIVAGEHIFGYFCEGGLSGKQ